jgi:hypothetical protein
LKWFNLDRSPLSTMVAMHFAGLMRVFRWTPAFAFTRLNDSSTDKQDWKRRERLWAWATSLGICCCGHESHPKNWATMN